MKLSKSLFDRYCKQGLLKKQEDERGLCVYTYTQFTQQEHLWNNITRKARGIVLDQDGEVVQFCFEKFFNYNEPEAYTDLAVRKISYEDLFQNSNIFEKIDGSLIKITKHSKYGLVITSKGSFGSDQVAMAKEILKENPEYVDALIENYTYLFELIHPQNRIVVDYGEEKDLKLLGVISDEGVEMPSKMFIEKDFPFKKASAIKDLDEYMNRDNVEGVVLVYNDLFRVKMKTEKYVELHRIVTNWTEKKVWEVLKSGEDPLSMPFPEEFQEWLLRTVADLQNNFSQVYADTLKKKEMLSDMSDKELGLSDFEDKNLIFALRRGNDISNKVWNIIKPEGGTR